MTYIVTSSTASAPPYFEIYHDRADTDDGTSGIPLNDTSYNTAGLADALVASPTFSAHPLNSVAGDSIIVNNTIDSSRLAKKSTGLSGVTMNAWHPDDSWWIAPSSSHKYFFECEILVMLPSTSDKIEFAGVGGGRSDVAGFGGYLYAGKIILDQTETTTSTALSNPTWSAGNYQLIKFKMNIPANSSYATSPHISYLSATDFSNANDYMHLDGNSYWNHHTASHSTYVGRRLKVIRRWAKLTQLA